MSEVRLPRFRVVHWFLAAAFALTAWVYFTQIHAPFYRDDAAHIKLNDHLHNPDGWKGLFTQANNDMTRYLTVSAYRAAWLVGGGESWSFHLMSLLVHLLNGVLVYLLMLRLLGREDGAWWALFVAALFWLHPMQVNPVIYASKFTVVLSTFFILLAILGALRAPAGREPYGWVLILSLLAILSKEIAVVTPLLVGLARVLFVLPGGQREWLRRCAPVYVGMSMLLGATFFMLNGGEDQASYGFHVQPAYQYFLTQLQNGWRYWALVVMAKSPAHIHPHPLYDLSVMWHGLAFLVAGSIGIYFLARYLINWKYVAFFVGFALLYLAPTHSWIPKRTAFAEYQFYFVNIGAFALLVLSVRSVLTLAANFIARHGGQGLWWIKMFRGSTGLRFVVPSLLLVVLSFASYGELKKWRDPMELAIEGAKVYPQDSTVACIMAEKAGQCGDQALADQMTMEFIKGEHNYYRYTPGRALQVKLDFLMKREEYKELLKQIRLVRERYESHPSATLYKYTLFALRANHLKAEYDLEIKAARLAYPGEKFLEFHQQVPVKELMRRNPEYWSRVQ